MSDRRVQDITTWFVIEETLSDLNESITFLCDQGLVPEGPASWSRKTDPPGAVDVYLQTVISFDPRRYTEQAIIDLIAASHA